MPETPSRSQPDEALIDLLVKQVTEGLSSAEQRELDVLDSAAASAYLRDLEKAAAALTVAASSGAEPLPAGLAQRLARCADEHVSALATANVVGLDAARGTRQDAAAVSREAAPPDGHSRSGTYGWLAAAACLLLAVYAWMRSPPQTQAPNVVVVPSLPATPSVPPPPAAPTPSEERAAMLAQSNTVKVTLNATKDPAGKGVTGDAVWDPVTQKGFLHFVGLASNDPSSSQYQIWIFDAARDSRYPVDGGVFDVPAIADDVVIPINAALGVSKVAAFAVTVEKPGGVVVSARQHVVVLGAAS
jgi:hypothetical protein